MATQVRDTLRSDARDNRLRILAAARAALSEHGSDATVRDIAHRAGVGVATVHRHFGSRELLLSQAVADGSTLCSSVVAEGLALGDAWQAFAFVVERLMEAHAAGRPPLLSRTELDAERGHTLQLVLTLVRRAKDAGVLRADFVVEDLVVAVAAGETIGAGSPELRAAAARRLAALLLDSYRAAARSTTLPPAVRVQLPGRNRSIVPSQPVPNG